jgi:hypothetical protein
MEQGLDRGQPEGGIDAGGRDELAANPKFAIFGLLMGAGAEEVTVYETGPERTEVRYYRA